MAAGSSDSIHELTRNVRPRVARSAWGGVSERDRRIASRRRREAETQLKLLINESVDSKSLLSDFNLPDAAPTRYRRVRVDAA